MGNNSSKWDNIVHIKSRTNKQLEDLKVFWEEHLKKYDWAICREQLALVKLEIAERIGKPSR